MLKTIGAGIMAIALYGAASISAIKFDLFPAGAKASDKTAARMEMHKTRTINIPVISNGDVKGYLLVQFAFGIESVSTKVDVIAPEMYVLDEAFNVIYERSAKLGVNIERYELKELMPMLLRRVQARMPDSPVKDLLVQEFTFIPRADVR